MAARKTAVIIGAGPAGLTAALELLRRTDVRPIVIEASDTVGGISRTVNYKGYRMDIGGHRFFSKSDWVMNWWREILPVEAGAADATATITYRNRQRSVAIPGADAAGAAPADPEKVMLLRPRLSPTGWAPTGAPTLAPASGRLRERQRVPSRRSARSRPCARRATVVSG